MTRRLLVLVLALGCGSATAQAPHERPAPDVEVEVVLPGPDTLSAVSGGTLGFGLRLDERAGLTRSVRLSLQPPDGWASLLPARPLTLGRDGHALHLVSLRVPPDAEAGVYAVELDLRASDGWRRTVRRIVRVEARAALSVDVLDAPRHVVAGAAYAVTVLVTNTGNAPTEVAVEARSVLGDPISIPPTAGLLAAGGSAEIRLDVGTAGRSVAITDHLRVAAVSRAGQRAETGVAVQIVPRSKGPDRAETWPLVASLSAVSFGDTVTPIAGATGAVALDAEGMHRLSIEADGIGRYSESLFAPVPEAWLRYAGPRVDARIGTGDFGLSPATAASPAGFGARARVTFGRWDATAIARRPLPLRGPARVLSVAGGTHLGTSLGIQATPWAHLGVTALTADGPAPGRVATARVQAGAPDAAVLDVEGGLADGSRRPIYAARAVLARGTASLEGEVRRRDAMQPGRLTSLTTRTVTGRTELTPGLAAYGVWRSLQLSESRVEAVTPYLDRNTSGGLLWSRVTGSATWNAEVGARAQRYRRDAFVGNGILDRSNALAEGAVGVGWNGLRSALRGGYGRTVSRDTDSRMPAWRIGTELGLSRGTGNVTASLGLSEGTSLWDTRLSREWTASLAGTVPVATGFRLDGSVSRGQVEIEPGEGLGIYQTSSARLNATLSLPGGSELIVGGHAYKASFYEALHLRTTLRVPIRLPLPYSVERPRVSGRVVDRATGDGVAGVLFRFGNAQTFSDSEGTFSFDVPPEGGYLFLDRSTLGPGRVPVLDFPLQVRPGQSLQIDIAPAARIRGSLRHHSVLGTAARTDTLDVGGIAYAVLEAEGEGQRVRAVTDRDGRFSFTDLPLGQYSLRVVRATLPAGTRLEHETVSVDAQRDESVTWRVLPSERQIRVLAGGSLRLGAEATAPAQAATRLAAPTARAPEAPRAPATPTARAERLAFQDPVESRARRPHDGVLASAPGTPRAGTAGPTPTLPSAPRVR